MKKLLAVVDFQQDFVTGSLGFEKAKQLEEPIYQKIKQYQAEGQTICYTFDTHDRNYLFSQEGKKLPVPHCMEQTEGWKLYGRVGECLQENTLVFKKNTFGSLAFAEYLTKHAFDAIEFVGLVSNMCVLANCILAKSALPDAEIIVDYQCTASFDETLNEKTMDILTGLQITVINRGENEGGSR